MVEIIFEKENNMAIAKENNRRIGECEFIEENEKWNIVHTGVREEYQGQGIARKLVDEVLENARKNNKKVIADCSYAKRILEKMQK